jgi:hypothetical protein
MMSRWISLALLTLACSETDAPAGDPTDSGSVLGCTEIGCSDGFAGTFSPELEEQGSYLFTLDLDGVRSTCTVTLPIIASESCDGPLQISRSGSALPESEHSLPGFMIFSSDFSTYTLTIERDGVEILSWTEEPEWETYQPNGEGCEPICESAGSTLQVL